MNTKLYDDLKMKIHNLHQEIEASDEYEILNSLEHKTSIEIKKIFTIYKDLTQTLAQACQQSLLDYHILNEKFEDNKLYHQKYYNEHKDKIKRQSKDNYDKKHQSTENCL